VAETLDRAVLAGLREMVGDDPEFVAELVDTYLVDGRRLLDAMRAAADAGSAESLVRPAHTLKGNSLNLGAARLGELGRELEMLARAGSLDGAIGLIDEADAEFIRVGAALEDARSHEWLAG
jgi:histidine phosphotransfer protein HptB